MLVLIVSMLVTRGKGQNRVILPLPVRTREQMHLF